jgi:hypothetical protein
MPRARHASARLDQFGEGLGSGDGSGDGSGLGDGPGS